MNENRTHDEVHGLQEHPQVADESLRADAEALSHHLTRFHGKGAKAALAVRLHSLQERLAARMRACKAAVTSAPYPAALEMLEASRMLESALVDVTTEQKAFAKMPFLSVKDAPVPRVLHVAEQYIVAVRGVWSAHSLLVYTETLQRYEPLLLQEVLLLGSSLRLAQLEFLLDRADELFAPGLPAVEGYPLSAPIHSLRRMEQMDWRDLLEQVVAFHQVLAQDPAGAFSAMDDESRANYRARVAELAKRADLNEVQTAAKAVAMARAAATQPAANPRMARRMSHVGYYLFEEGLPAFSHAIGYHPPPVVRLRTLLKAHSETIYILSIFVLSTALIAAFIAPLVPHHHFPSVIAALLLALIPASVGASDLINNAVTTLFPPRALPKLDYLVSIPKESTTLVVVPTLLLNEIQVHEAFDELEARYLSNGDTHLHFGLLTDLPDSQERPQQEDRNELVEMAIRCTNELNAKYGHEGHGSFLLLHRHRVFNAKQGVWMGWERKRGKLLDLNKLMMGVFDSFPIKAGPVDVLNTVRYVITLDSDTQLPRGTAARMIGAIAHPLNQAILDQEERIVRYGYGILQPRVGVSVASASRSRLASLYSGETGFDIYTRAVSDVYQDLFGEGIFTGKGIYEVAVLHEVLDRRFPRNSLLSHDLIEGAYARAGLATDIEVVDDYPSHYSAHTRRKHRWLRGDWQLLQWLGTRVPDESGKYVHNPISLISRWKMIDNLRRSLLEPVTFFLFVLGWIVLPGGAEYWTIILVTLMVLPAFVQLLFSLGRALQTWSRGVALDGLQACGVSLGVHLLNLAFLAHQTLLSVDAIVRSLVRRFLTGERLLEWETAAQSEVNRARSTLDLYLQLSPVVALGIAVFLYLHERPALVMAGPVLFLWAISPLISMWLDSPPRKSAKALTIKDQSFLEDQVMTLWRYFADFGGPENHWLIPDNVEEREMHQTRKLSPTNLGMLFNARQAAMRVGLLTLPEFVEATAGTLHTYERLEKWNGHIYNWYDIETLSPIQPIVVSTVDSGNLAASLYTLHAGALDLFKMPLLGVEPFVMLARMLEGAGIAKTPATEFRGDTAGLFDAVKWMIELDLPASATSGDASRSIEEASRRRASLLAFVTDFVPWLLPRFTPLFGIQQFFDPDNEVMPPLRLASQYIRSMQARLERLHAAEPTDSKEALLAQELVTLLHDAAERTARLDGQLRWIAAEAERHADAMRYDVLFVESRQLLSIAFDAETNELNSACYDLLASEARIASFLAVAKGDIPQRAWFSLDRTHTMVKGRASLLSWTGTMFEYLMPALWMRNYPDTLITRSLDAAVAIQRQHVNGMPWGISESGYAKTDAQGRYSYQAWGIPVLALKYAAEDGPVISPYSSFLAMPFVRADAIANLQKMEKMGWVGAYGFYEAADYTEGSTPELVRSWMAHHQGMSLLAATNLLCGNVFEQWFHANPKVRAAELLLHERPLSKQAVRSMKERGELTKSMQ